jgi:hypothetical protein
VNLWFVLADDGEVERAIELPQGASPTLDRPYQTVFRILNTPKTRSSIRHALKCLEISAKNEITEETTD